MTDKFPRHVYFSALKIDCSAVPLILTGLMKYLPSGETGGEPFAEGQKSVDNNLKKVPSLERITFQFMVHNLFVNKPYKQIIV